MPDALIPTNDAIDTIIGMLRQRMEAACRNGQKIKANARSGLKKQVWEPGKKIVAEEDGSFEFTLYIEPRK